MVAKIKPQNGTSYPLGSTPDDNGVNFAIFSANAEKIELCLFDETGTTETHRFELPSRENNIWSIYLEGAKIGQVYGYRVYGKYEPSNGHRFNPNKLLIDPYGKQLIGKLIWHKAIFGYDFDHPDKDLSFSELDSAPYVPKSVVVSNDFDWEGDKHPNTKFEDTIIYEAHVKGYTKLHPQVLEKKRGTFEGFASKCVTKYLKWLGVTAVEFLPVHAYFGDRYKKGYITDNYWGYDSLSFFAPEQTYLAGQDISEFKQMVKEMHKNGLEVILDVVYNHTGEGNQLGPTLCYRGIDNASYYIPNPEDKRYYVDTTGTGATFNVNNPNVLRLVMDSLRYWVEEMHVDGFRFDLATTLSRQNLNFSQESGFMYACAQDPILKKVKLIAEPWDVGFGGYQVGAFLPGWAEWNDKYRDTVRRLWKGDEGQVADFASRFVGSSDIFNYNNRAIWSSINFITAHDGFSLMDLVSYNGKHNQVNGEDNRDGNDSNWSWNSGAEGESDSQVILDNRYARIRAMMSTLLLSFGTPMITAGDEFGRTQFGNNNPYCQDNILSWIAWEAMTERDIDLLRFTKKLIELRKKSKTFSRTNFFTGTPDGKNNKDLSWYDEFGKELNHNDWMNSKRKTLSSLAIVPNSYYFVILNADFKDTEWKLPNIKGTKQQWSLILDTNKKSFKKEPIDPTKKLKIPSWSILLFEVK